MRWLRCRSGRSGRNDGIFNVERTICLAKDQLLILLWIAHVGTDNWMHATLSCWWHFGTLQVWLNSKLVVPTCLPIVCLCLFVYHRFSLPVAKDSQLAAIQSCWCGTGSKVPVFHKTPLLLVLFGAPDCWNSVEARRQLKCVVRRPDTRGMSDSQKNMPSVAAVLHVCALYKMQADVCSMI